MFREFAVHRSLAWSFGVAAIVLGAAQSSAEVTVQHSDVIGQGMVGPVVAPDGAKLVRSEKGLNVSIRIPTPVGYVYPTGNMWNPDAVPGHPEVYSFWVFVFNYPEECAIPNACGLSDFGAGRGAPAAFNAGGHVLGDAPHLQLSGRISLNSTPFLPPGGALIEPETAEVHFAIAPHGQLSPEDMPNQINTPIGSPDHWWMAFFH
ncbi:hypothetical protein FV139_13750 [Parahaliea maris]|uniref:Uncharacterized protein n=1 Tax=Parahaliea maris TaxID=2716870 RepID=A0A5C8ZYX2_9GAMM|nr:hypothetical protein [Parahaliea maris]TXS93009.1 hypothetical protein FV139_13750 [Parahaliea maris]